MICTCITRTVSEGSNESESSTANYTPQTSAALTAAQGNAIHTSTAHGGYFLFRSLFSIMETSSE